MVSLEELEKVAKETLEALGTHEPMIYLDFHGKLVSYLLFIHRKEEALKYFRELITKEEIPQYWTVTESWISRTRGLSPSQDINRKEMLMISEYNGTTMETKKILLPFERKFKEEELMEASERIRDELLERGMELPKVTPEDMKDPKMRRILTDIHPDGSWGGDIVWGQKEAFSIGLNQGDAHWADRWDFYREDICVEIDEKMEKKRIADLVKEMQEMDLTDMVKFAEEMWRRVEGQGIELPPVPSEYEIRQTLIRMAESGNLIKIEDEPVDIHEAVREMKDSDPNIPASQIHAMGDE